MGCGDPRTADLVRIKKRMQESTDRRFGPNKKGMQESTDRRFGPNFKKGIQGSTDRRFDQNFKKGMQESRDRRFGPNFKEGMQGSLDRQFGQNFKKGMQGSTDRRFGQKFFKGDAGIHGPPVWSELKKNGCRDPPTTDLVRIKKKVAGIHWPLALVQILKKGMHGSTDHRFGLNF